MTRRPRFRPVAAADYLRDPTEAEMEQAIRDVVKLKGGRCWHVERTDQCPEMIDFWDTTILVPGLVLLLELKSQHRGWESAGQAEVALALNGIRRVVSGVVRPVPVSPDEYAFDEVLDILRRV